MSNRNSSSAGQASVQVESEIGSLRQVLMHFPDSGIGKVVPSKAQEWLYEDIVELSKMREEYANFRRILLAYLDPDTLAKWFASELGYEAIDPMSEHFIPSQAVVEVQDLLRQVLEDERLRVRIVSAVCALEQTAQSMEDQLLNNDKIDARELSNTLVTGHLPDGRPIFAPIPNFVFTRDIGITIHDSILLSRFATPARTRESLLSKYVLSYQVLGGDLDKVIEVTDDTHLFLESDQERDRMRVTIEGGDVMMVSSEHLIVGCSERTSPQAIYRIIESLFSKEASQSLQKVSVVKIPQHRSCMHIDTVFTQVSRDTWVLFAPLAKGKRASQQSQAVQQLFGDIQPSEKLPLQVLQFTKEKDSSGDYQLNRNVHDLESLLTQVSVEDFSVEPNAVQFIYSGGGKSPEAEREQWTDSCNVVCIQEGLVVGYERNQVTALEFEKKGFKVVSVNSLVRGLHEYWKKDSSAKFDDYLKREVGQKALLLIEAAELSRARGGPHCMTMPLRRDPVT